LEDDILDLVAYSSVDAEVDEDLRIAVNPAGCWTVSYSIFGPDPSQVVRCPSNFVAALRRENSGPVSTTA